MVSGKSYVEEEIKDLIIVFLIIGSMNKLK